jgi:hypothetical protein
VTAADSAAVRARAVALRDEIMKGAKFEDVAKRESQDPLSGAQGGSLGRGPKGRFVEAFEKAAFALTPGQVSEPIETQFGVHLIKVDEKKADTIAVRHLLLRFQQSDSSASRTDKMADQLARWPPLRRLPAVRQRGEGPQADARPGHCDRRRAAHGLRRYVPSVSMGILGREAG